ncbi:hypothetical protein [Curtobacterium sp. VKM Ac-1376]|uniref:hypothetical protein n=1 Tax=Curtobacterium sp. VKM Ac-1376 TaxID=123312 RepID=UPI00188C2F1F|nr:hypothetical protein [Curtobacterium sp. VKM Ac-1376]MBF4615213.1 hypothetical protein [Curtobacterium sp. VKM Ac-1376]
MTHTTINDQGAVRLQAASSVRSVPDALTGLPGLEARPALLTLVTPGGAPVCEGDACLIDAGSFAGAEGDWSEVPD